jgi:hypothetical protein
MSYKKIIQEILKKKYDLLNLDLVPKYVCLSRNVYDILNKNFEECIVAKITEIHNLKIFINEETKNEIGVGV